MTEQPTLSDGEPTEAAREAWMKAGEYLPDFLRDFHDQKDAFKAIHEMSGVQEGYVKDVSWIAAQVYTIDFFLWWCARRGYTLQRSRKPVLFRDAEADIAEAKRARNALTARVLLSAFSTEPSHD